MELQTVLSPVMIIIVINNWEVVLNSRQRLCGGSLSIY